jgi:hypothetical protein
MSSFLDAVFVQSVVALQSSGHGRAFRVVDGGRMFTGTLRTEPIIDPGMELGSDPRERVWLDVLPAINFLTSQAVILEGRMVNGQFVGEQKWKVVKSELNPADVENKYELVKIIEGDK